jgi:hypothetical protein
MDFHAGKHPLFSLFLTLYQTMYKMAVFPYLNCQYMEENNCVHLWFLFGELLAVELLSIGNTACVERSASSFLAGAAPRII